jgi:hypothetical protein
MLAWRASTLARRAFFNGIKENTMGFFSNILEKLGMSKAAQAPVITPPAAPADAPAAAPVPAAAPAVASITMVDVMALMEKKAAANPQKLNWKTSIVDLLKLLELDSSLEARKALAKELYCPDELMGDSAKMNMWLHKNVLAHIAANGGNVPKELFS